MNVYRISESILNWKKKMYNYPDGFDGRIFDTRDFTVVCPKCGIEWEEEWSGDPDEFDTECHECGHTFIWYTN